MAVSGVAARGGTAPVQVVVQTNLHKATKLSREVGAAMPETAMRLSNKQLKAREARRQTARPAVAVEVAHAGQSYRPDPAAHQPGPERGDESAAGWQRRRRGEQRRQQQRR